MHVGGHETSWTAYLRGEYPDYRVDILRHNHAWVHQRLAFMCDDQQDPATYGDWHLQIRNPITVEGLVQLTKGGPLFMYNGGLLQARLRYFDAARRRPGLPTDVAVLGQTHEAHFQEVVKVQLETNTVDVNNRLIAFSLQPRAQIRLDLGMDRFTNQPSYALPWEEAANDG